MCSENQTIDDLERWVRSGGQWRVIEISPQRAVVDLCACTGESMQRLESADPHVIGYLRTAHPEG